MEIPHFIFWEGLKTVGLIFLALLSVKLVASLAISAPAGSPWPRLTKGALYGFILVMVILGGRVLGYDTAAEIYFWTAQKNVNRGQIRRAYSNARRAVELRPGDLRYWELLDQAKVSGQQFASALQDEPALKKLGRGELSLDDEARFATCRYFLGQYDQVLAMTRRIIQENRLYPFAYVLQGMAYIGLRQYGAAESTLLDLLGVFPTQAAAVSELAQAYYLSGDTPRALAVLNATRKYPFPSAARKRFEELKALYAQ